MPLGGPPALLRCLGSIWRTLVPCRGDITCMTGQEGQLSHGQGVSGRIPGPPLQPMMGGATLTHHTSLRLPARSHAHSYYPPSSLSGSSLLCKHTHSLSISLSLSLSLSRTLALCLAFPVAQSHSICMIFRFCLQFPTRTHLFLLLSYETQVWQHKCIAGAGGRVGVDGRSSGGGTRSVLRFCWRCRRRLRQ